VPQKVSKISINGLKTVFKILKGFWSVRVCH